MQKRSKMPRRTSKKVFRKTANRTHKFNMPYSSRVIMRGGIRL